ncbi:MAG: hypothetical protein I4N51_12540 [Acinetobacter sp.]|nr:hypothetical protein [Acinetobacter sp.]
MALITLGSLLPAMLFGLLSIKLISPKTKLRNTGWVIGALFLALIALGAYFGFSMAKKEMFLKGHKEDTEEVSINTKSDTLYVDYKQVTIPQNFKGYDDDIYSDKISVYEKDWIHVDVTRKADIKTPYLIIKKEAKGYNLPLSVTVPVEVADNKIILPNYIKYPYEHRFRDYSIDYELVLPLKTIVIPAKKDGINFDGDLNADGINDNDQERDEDGKIKIENNKITVNGSTIEYNSDDEDSIIVNGKKVPSNQADKVIDSMKHSIKKNERGEH